MNSKSAPEFLVHDAQRRAAELLEWPKVLDRLAEYVSCLPARTRCASLPLVDTLEDAQKLSRQTDDARKLLRAGSTPPLGEVTDLTPQFARLRVGAALSAEELVRVADILHASRRIRILLLDRWEEIPHLSQMGVGLYEDFALEREILTAIERDGHVTDQASPELARLRDQYRKTQKRIHDTMTKLAAASELSEYLQDDFFTLRNGRYVLVVRIEKQSFVDGIVHDISGTRQSVFIEPREITALNNTLRGAEIAIDEEIHRILVAFSKRVAAIEDELAAALEALIQIDLTFAKARYAEHLGASVAKLNDAGRMTLRYLFHPLLIEQERAVVKNTVQIADDVACMVVTGPNTGGKTVLLKAIGLTAYMVRAGMHPPVGPDSDVSLCSRIFALIGDSQSIETGLSTFAARIVAIKDVLAGLAQRSLVLIDEIGEGTDPRQGVALSMALLERLTERNTLTIATTHFTELAAMATTRPGFQNASMEFDSDRLQPTYRLRIGIPGRSGAFDIAARMGLDESLVARARQLYEGTGTELDTIIDGLDKTRAELEHELSAARAARHEAQQKLEMQKERLRNLDSSKSELAERELGRVRKLYDDALAQIRGVIADLQRESSFKNAETARAKVNEIVAAVESATPASKTHARTPIADRPIDDWSRMSVGDPVRVVTMKKDGVLETLPDVKDMVRVQVGGLRVTVPVADIAKPKGDRVQKPVEIAKGWKPAETATFEERTLDLRGEPEDNALQLLEQYLDEAWRARWETVYIVHGHGMGVLKRAVRDYLKNAPYPVNYRPGRRGEGGDGATVVSIEFKDD
ncbi:MAG: endonuclease MutS2 [Deltaproteobacteria bacterium]|nr:endonuclease MutS2 [Deltaproteobacteria bacterium]